MRNLLRLVFAFAVIVLSGVSARAEDAFYSVALKDLKLVDGKIPEPKGDAEAWRDWRHTSRLEPTMRVDSPAAEAYLVFGERGFAPDEWVAANGPGTISVVLRAAAGTEVTGRLYVPAANGSGLTPVKFSVPAAAVDPGARAAFFNGKQKHFQSLFTRRLPGAAWFRYQAQQAAIEAGQKPDDANTPNRNGNGSEGDLSETLDLFSGGRAVSENLQLDRGLFPRPGGDQSVPIDSIQGISVREMDWKPLIKDLHPAVDKLATLIPGDQHGIFFPSFTAATITFDEADLRATPIFEQFDSSSQDAGTKVRYRRQLCLPETMMSRLLGPQAIAGMAITGSDPYLRVGSDMAVLFQPVGRLDLHAMLLSSMARAAADGAGADGPIESVKGDVGGIAFTGWVSPARRICAYLATVDGIEVVTNSKIQLQRLSEVRGGKKPALTEAPEYTFFRNRYSRDDADETAFVVLPDAAIRRWCSPRWRIGDSRRTRAAAVMTDVQARHVDEIIAGKINPATQPATNPSDDLTVTAAGVQSPIYGSLDFMTPIAELQIDKVTQSESDMYGRWRDTYQQNWSNYFDPIGARLSVTSQRTAMDVSVMPLIAGSEYHQFIDLCSGVKIGADSGDRHDDLFHLALAINRESQTMKQGAGMLTGIGGVQIDPLGWIGPTVSLYVDKDPIWQQVAAAKEQGQFLEQHLTDLPVVLYLQSSNPMKLALFLVGVHAFVDASAPGMTHWTTIQYGQLMYTKITPSDQAKTNNADFKDSSICYAVADGALLISPNEPALKRAIDRQNARAIAATQPAATQASTTQPADAAPWLGDSLCALIDVADAQKTLLAWMGSSYQSTVQERAWANLPILNEWHRRFPAADAVQVHEKLFQSELRDPAGGRYTWNDPLQTMESANYGCPEEPKTGPVWPTGLDGITRANLGLTFEDQGMRAKMELRHDGVADR